MDNNLLRHFIKLESSISLLINKINSISPSKSVDNHELVELLSSISYINSNISNKLSIINDLLRDNFNKLFNYLLMIMGVIILSSGLSWYIKSSIVGVVGLKYFIIYIIKKILFYVKQSELNKVEFDNISRGLKLIDLGE